ncbi:MAG: hypothetical protein AAFY56_17965 [Pseudomonadota bacterium]
MTDEHANEADESGPVSIDDEMAKYGITRVPAEHFFYRTYRYTSLSDAMAQAKRDEKAGNS